MLHAVKKQIAAHGRTHLKDTLLLYILKHVKPVLCTMLIIILTYFSLSPPLPYSSLLPTGCYHKPSVYRDPGDHVVTSQRSRAVRDNSSTD